MNPFRVDTKLQSTKNIELLPFKINLNTERSPGMQSLRWGLTRYKKSKQPSETDKQTLRSKWLAFNVYFQ